MPTRMLLPLLFFLMCLAGKCGQQDWEGYWRLESGKPVQISVRSLNGHLYFRYYFPETNLASQNWDMFPPSLSLSGNLLLPNALPAGSKFIAVTCQALVYRFATGGRRNGLLICFRPIVACCSTNDSFNKESSKVPFEAKTVRHKLGASGRGLVTWTCSLPEANSV